MTISFLFFCFVGSYLAAQNEVDKLVSKYEGKDVVFYTTEGELRGTATVKRNPDGKPFSISIYGESNEKTPIAELLHNLFKQKLNEGYRLTKDNVSPLLLNMSIESLSSQIHLVDRNFSYPHEGIDVDFSKGNYVFKAKAGVKAKSESNSNMFPRTYYIPYFEIMMIDKSRLGGSGAKTFDF